MARKVCVVVASLLAGARAAEEPAPPAVWADLRVSEQRADASLRLLVQNRAATPIHLANCEGSHAVPAEGSAALTLSGLSGFWVVPEGLQWDCQAGPFDLFYVAANLTGPELVAGVGFGFVPDDSEAGAGSPEGEDDMANATTAGEPAEEEAAQEQESDAVAGVDLAAVTVVEDGVPTARCREGLCAGSTEVKVFPEALTLSIMGPQASMLSFWRGGGGGGGGRGRGGGGWGRRGWGRRGRRGWGRRGWGWGGSCKWWCHNRCFC